MASSTVPQESEKLRQAVRWISEETLQHPEKKRKLIIREAELRFDLTPAECEFLDNKFCG